MRIPLSARLWLAWQVLRLRIVATAYSAGPDGVEFVITFRGKAEVDRAHKMVR